MSLQKKRGKLYLTQGALQLPQEVVVTQVNSFVVDVINPKLQFLDYFKVVVDDKLFRKLWAEAVLDFLCACHLSGKVGWLCVFFLLTLTKGLKSSMYSHALMKQEMDCRFTQHWLFHLGVND